MTVKQECTICLLIFFGVIFSVIGFIMLMVGSFHEPGNKKAKSREIEDEIEQEKTHLKNTQIAGIIFLVVVIVSIIYGIILKRRILKERVKQGTNATSSTGGVVVGYDVSGNIAPNQANNYQAVPSLYAPHMQFQPTKQTIPPPSQIQAQPQQHYQPPTQTNQNRSTESQPPLYDEVVISDPAK